MKLLYDIDIVGEDDKYIALVQTTLEGVVQGLVAGKFLVEFFPFLRHIPAWSPGAGFLNQFHEWKAASDSLRSTPVDHVKCNMVNGMRFHLSLELTDSDY